MSKTETRRETETGTETETENERRSMTRRRRERQEQGKKRKQRRRHAEKERELTINPLYQALICCLLKFVLSMRNVMSSFDSFLLPDPPISPTIDEIRA